MKSLKEICIDAVVKFGVGPRGDLPSTLPAELESKDEIIQKYMTGVFDTLGCIWCTETIEFCWERKCDENTGFEWSEWLIKTKNPPGRAEISAGRRSYLMPEMGPFFLLEPMERGYVHDFHIDVTNKIVTFYGAYTRSGKWANFNTRFTFVTSIGEEMEVTTEVTKNGRIYHAHASYDYIGHY